MRLSTAAKVLAKMNVQVRRQKGSGDVSRLAVLEIKYKTNQKNGEHEGKSCTEEVVMPITPQNVKESISVLYAFGNCLMRDLGRRFHGTYIVTDLQFIWRVDLDLSAA